MKDEDKIYWINVFILIAGVICLITLSVTACTIKSNDQVLDMVKCGANPIQASCSINGAGNVSQAICMASSDKSSTVVTTAK